MENEYQVIAVVLLRIFAATLFIFQGYDKLFRIKIPAVVVAFQAPAQKHNVPKGLLYFIAWYSSIAEFIGGILLLVGFLQPFALIAIGIDLILVAIAFGVVQPVWDMKHVFPRLILVFILLYLIELSTYCSIDRFVW